jgi:tetratricopeptide (TPR) repeat protein
MADSHDSPAVTPYRHGAICFKTRDYDEAIRQFRIATEADPAFYRAWAYLAMSFAAAGRIEEAIEAYRKCIDIEPTYHKAYNNIGELYRRKGMLELAATVFKMAAEIDPTHAQYLYNLGLTYADLGQLPQAEEALAKANRMEPADFECALELAQVLFGQKKYDLATQVLEAFLQAAPGHAREPEVKARIKMLNRRLAIEKGGEVPSSSDRSTRIIPIESPEK